MLYTFLKGLHLKKSSRKYTSLSPSDRLKDLTFFFEDHAVHINADEALRDVLRSGKYAGRRLADHIKKVYEEQTGTVLEISRGSLNAEIHIHALLDRWFIFFERIFGWFPPLKKFFHQMHVHTFQIDCGERSVDSNRFVFDILAPLYGGKDKKEKQKKNTR